MGEDYTGKSGCLILKKPILYRNEHIKNLKKQWIKRIVAFGGETIEIKDGAILINGKILDQNNIKKHLYINAGEYGSEGKAILILENHFFVLGDYSEKSFDSRYWGFLPEENL